MLRFRGGLVLKAHRLCVSLDSRLESNKEEEEGSGVRVQGSGVRAQGSGVRDQGLGVRGDNPKGFKDVSLKTKARIWH